MWYNIRMKKLREKMTNKILYKLEKNRGVEPKQELSLPNFKEFNKLILEFIEIFNNYFEKYNTNLYNNLNTLHIVVDHSPNNEYEGEYDAQHNTIYVSIPIGKEYKVNKEVKDTLFHELLHLASNNKHKKYSGFNHDVNVLGAKKLGRGINEGYTEYLLIKYFRPNTNGGFYNDEMRIVKELEKIIGEDKMIDYYFNGNLYDLILDLSKNNNYEEIISLIKDIDLLALRNKEELIDKVKNRGAL